MRKHIALMGTLSNMNIADSMIVINGGEKSKVTIINYGVESARRRLRYIPLYEPPQQFSGFFLQALAMGFGNEEHKAEKYIDGGG
jgi:hypothetical protein